MYVSVAPSAKLSVVPIPMSREPAPTSAKLKPTKKPSAVAPSSTDSTPALTVAKSNAYVPAIPHAVAVSYTHLTLPTNREV